MIKVNCQYGYFNFIFENNTQINEFQIRFGELVNNQFIWQYNLQDRYTLINNNFYGNNPIVNYESNNFIDLLRVNNLAIDNANKVIRNYKKIIIHQILNHNLCLGGLFFTDRNIKSYNGFYDLDNNQTFISTYETY